MHVCRRMASCLIVLLRCHTRLKLRSSTKLQPLISRVRLVNLTKLSKKNGLMGADEVLANVSHDWFFDSSNCCKVYFSYGSEEGNCILLIYSNGRLSSVFFQLSGAFPSRISVYFSLPSPLLICFSFYVYSILRKEAKIQTILRC